MKLIILTLILSSILPFRHFSSREGVQQTTIHAITQDNNNHIWLGTNDGLCRISGFHTHTYRSNDNTPGALKFDHISYLYTDSEGMLWICSPEGMCIHRPGSDQFIPVDIKPIPSKILDLRNEKDIERSGIFLAATENVLMEIDVDSLKIIKQWNFGKKIMDIGVYGEKVFIGIKNEGIFHWHLEDGLVPVLKQKQSSGYFTIKEDGYIWTMSPEECILFNPETEEKKNFIISDKSQSRRIICLESDSDGNLWAATSEGIIIIRKDGSTSVEQHNISNKESLGDNSIQSLFKSRDGGMWVGTFYNGVHYYHPKSRIIRAISSSSIPGADHIICRALKENPSDGKIWMGTANLGILIFDPNDRTLRIFRERSSNNDIVNAIEFVPDRKKILLGLFGKEMEIISDGRTHRVDFGKGIFAIKRYSDNLFLICCEGSLRMFDIDSERISTLISPEYSGRALCVAEDPESGDIWAGFDHMIVRASILKDERGEIVCNVKERFDEPENVVDIKIDSNVIWFASNKGLLKYDKTHRSWDKLNTSCGWPTNLIQGIETDKSGKMWISTENGIVRFSPSDERMRHIDKQDGLESMKFNPFAHCETHDGIMYFGGTDCVYSFNPIFEPEIAEIPDPSILSVKTDGKSIMPSRLITVSAGSHNLEILMDVADYTRQSDWTIEYKMDGYDNEWKNTRGEHKVEYNSLPKGRYIFKVRTTDDEDRAKEMISSMTVIVKPAWYQSSLFYACIIVLIVSLIVYAFIIQEEKSRKEIHRIETQAKLDISQIRAESIAVRPMKEKDRELLMNVVETIDQNIENAEFGVQELAEALEMSRSNLNIRIKTITDVTPLEIIRKIRFEKAYKMLLSGNYKINEVASATGFTSATYFTYNFRKETGLTPSQWVSQNKNI